MERHHDETDLRLPTEGEVVLATVGKDESGVHQILMYGDADYGFEALEQLIREGDVELLETEPGGVHFRRIE